MLVDHVRNASALEMHRKLCNVLDERETGSNYIKAVIHDVHKVSLQFQKFIKKANEKTDEWKLLESETCIFVFSSSASIWIPLANLTKVSRQLPM